MAIKSAFLVLLLSLFATSSAQEQPPSPNVPELMAAYNPIIHNYNSLAVVNGWHMANACLLRPLTNPNTMNKKNLPELFIIPGVSEFKFREEKLLGLSDWTKKPGKIYVAEGFKDNAIAWAHEFLHILSEEPNHIYMLFMRCQLYIRLVPEQG